MRLTMKAIIRWEQLNKKPFSQLDYSSEDEIISLFYVCNQPDRIMVSLVEFKKDLKEEEAKRMIKDFERQTTLMAQFQTESKKKDDDDKDSNPVYVKDIVPILIMNGLDVYFALNEMELCDLPVYLKAYDQKVKTRLTEQRLWTFLQLSPHLEKGTSPKDIYPFSWEMEEEAISEEDIMKGKDEFSAFLKNGLKQ